MTATPGQGTPPPGADDPTLLGYLSRYCTSWEVGHDEWARVWNDPDGGELRIVAALRRVLAETDHDDVQAIVQEEFDRPGANDHLPDAANGVRVQATEYVVSALPEDDGDGPFLYGGSWGLTVAYRGRGGWAVVQRSHVLSVDGQWDYERIPSERIDEWIAAHRFDRDTALRLASEWAPSVRVNGHSVADIRAQIEKVRDA